MQKSPVRKQQERTPESVRKVSTTGKHNTHTHAHTLTTVPPRISGSAALWRLFNKSKNKQKSLAAQIAPMVI